MVILRAIAENIPIKPTHKVERDPKDSFLLDLIDFGKADYLVTGDNDLLELNPFKSAHIVTPNEFEQVLKNWKD